MTENQVRMAPATLAEPALFTFEYPKSQLDFILNFGNTYISVKDRQGCFVYVNDLEASLYDCTPHQLLGKTVEEFVGHDRYLQWLKDDLTVVDSRKTLHSPPYSRVDKAGNTHWFDTIKTPFVDEINDRELLLTIHRDITVIKKEQTERELFGQTIAKAQKKELIRALSGSVAHDFNNLLTIIMASAKVIQVEPQLPAHVKQSNETIIDTCYRAAEIVSRLLMLGGNDSVQFSCIDLNQCLRDDQNPWMSAVKENIRLKYDLSKKPATIQGNADMIKQALWQLILNAQDAVRNQGEIRVQTSRHENEKSEQIIQVQISDNGEGMTRDTLDKLFHPMFSTKPSGQGSGLGLTLVENVVTRHGGKIQVKSAPGAGTTFTLEFPAVQPPVVRSAARRGEMLPTHFTGKTIMLAEDEALLRTILTKILTAKGAIIVAAANGDEAWELLEKNLFKIDFLVTDIVMPSSIDGVTLRRRLGKERADIPAIIMSGYSFDFISESEPLPEKTQFLRKPFSPDILVEMLNQTLSKS